MKTFKPVVRLCSRLHKYVKYRRAWLKPAVEGEVNENEDVTELRSQFYTSKSPVVGDLWEAQRHLNIALTIVWPSRPWSVSPPSNSVVPSWDLGSQHQKSDPNNDNPCVVAKCQRHLSSSYHQLPWGLQNWREKLKRSRRRLPWNERHAWPPLPGWGVPVQAGPPLEKCPPQSCAAGGSPGWDHWFPPGHSPYSTIPDVVFFSPISLVCLCTAIKEWYVRHVWRDSWEGGDVLTGLLCWCASSCAH